MVPDPQVKGLKESGLQETCLVVTTAGHMAIVRGINQDILKTIRIEVLSTSKQGLMEEQRLARKENLLRGLVMVQINGVKDVVEGGKIGEHGKMGSNQQIISSKMRKI